MLFISCFCVYQHLQYRYTRRCCLWLHISFWTHVKCTLLSRIVLCRGQRCSLPCWLQTSRPDYWD